MRLKIQRVAAILLAAILLTCPVLAASAFPDVDENAEYAEAAEFLNEIGIMVGDEKGNFNPDKPVTRAEMAAIICRMLGETEDLAVDGSTFADVPAAHWANGYVVRAASLGIINGYGDGYFGPNDTVTYEQAITMIVRAVGWDEDTGNIDTIGGYPDGFIFLAYERGLLQGVSASKGDMLSRSIVASLIYNFYVPPFMF